MRTETMLKYLDIQGCATPLINVNNEETSIKYLHSVIIAFYCLLMHLLSDTQLHTLSRVSETIDL